MNTNKYIEKRKYQDKVNPGHKVTYEPPLRPRSASFKLKTKYNRSNNKKVVQEARYDY